jgi:phenylpyruvate tautomerase PptA (4-oxalocrotonate tautomerase family)
MPIVDVTVVVGRDESVAADLAQSLANTIGRALKVPSAQTWLRLHVLPQERYAENSSSLNATELPVFVVVLTRELPERSQLGEAIAALTHAVSEATGRASDRVHIEYAPSARGRVSFGGKLVE